MDVAILSTLKDEPGLSDVLIIDKRIDYLIIGRIKDFILAAFKKSYTFVIAINIFFSWLSYVIEENLIRQQDTDKSIVTGKFDRLELFEQIIFIILLVWIENFVSTFDAYREHVVLLVFGID